eukprot:1146625-Pelagomonas_calceolata.AAC.4
MRAIWRGSALGSARKVAARKRPIHWTWHVCMHGDIDTMHQECSAEVVARKRPIHWTWHRRTRGDFHNAVRSKGRGKEPVHPLDMTHVYAWGH